MEPLHDVTSAAKLLAVSPWTVRAYIRVGRLSPVRIGRLVRLDESEIKRFIAVSRTRIGLADQEQSLEKGKDE